MCTYYIALDSEKATGTPEAKVKVEPLIFLNNITQWHVVSFAASAPSMVRGHQGRRRLDVLGGHRASYGAKKQQREHHQAAAAAEHIIPLIRKRGGAGGLL